MNSGILIIDKPKGITSRKVVDEVSKKFSTRKVGHTGTLDPIATGVLVICVGGATKLVDDIISNDKEYIASVELGTLTDTLDLDGTVIENRKCLKDKSEIEDVLNEFKTTYMQEVPAYSAVKINGKKLYECARSGQIVELPKREVTIYDISLIGNIEYINDKTRFKFKCTVSKGTYIRSLIYDIAKKLNTIGIMTDLRRIRQGKFKIEDAIKLEDADLNNLIRIKDALDIKTVELDSSMEKKVLNGAPISNIYSVDKVLFLKNGVEVALYTNDNGELKSYKMFKGGV